MRKLILFDIDGTLLSTRGAARRAFERAMLEVYGTAGPIATHAFDGKTDPQIARELLTCEGLDEADIDAGLPALWSDYLRELELELARPDHSTDIMPGVEELLAALETESSVLTGLLTGNIERGAALKVLSAGLPQFRFGAFGSDCERRDGLPPIAVDRARALCGVAFSGREIIVIGDTPADVRCGQALGVHAIAVATGRHDPHELRRAGADAVLEDLSATSEVLHLLLG